MESCAGWMVRAVNLNVTGYAAASDDSRVTVSGILPGGQVFGGESRNGMVSNADLCVACLTEKGRRRDE